MQTSWKRRLLFVPPVLLAILLLMTVARNKPAPEQNEPQELATTARAITVEPVRVIPRIIGFGVVEPGRVWEAVAQVSGRVEAVHPNFKKGAILSKGAEIVRIAPEDYEIAVREAEANIRAAEAKLNELKVNAKNIEAALAIERQSLTLNEKELRRKQTLERRGSLASSTLDQERRNLLSQKQKVLGQENALNLLPTQIQAQEEQIAINKAKLRAANLNLARTSIKLPFDARISAANVEVTQYVAAGAQLGSADSMQTAEITAQIPQSRLHALMRASTSRGQTKPLDIGEGALSKLSHKLGMHAVVRLHFGNEVIEWPGKVVRISDTVDNKTRTVGTIVAVSNVYKGMVPGERPPLVKGMFTEVEIRANKLDNALVIPRAAVHNGNAYLADKDNRLRIKPVTIKLIQGDFVVIESGIAAGDKVVISNLSPAIDGMLLRPIADERAARRLQNQANGGGSVR